jgi:preprotein translocase subunit Sec63
MKSLFSSYEILVNLVYVMCFMMYILILGPKVCSAKSFCCILPDFLQFSRRQSREANLRIVGQPKLKEQHSILPPVYDQKKSHRMCNAS